jgi:hypothetical protein
MAKLSFKIQPPLLVNQEVTDAGGNWQYVGANAVDEGSGVKVQLVATKRANGTGQVSFSGSMLTATVIFPSQEHGVSEHLTIQGLHDLTSNNEIGSVSSASRKFSEYIGGAFVFDSAEGRLTVFSRGKSE